MDRPSSPSVLPPTPPPSPESEVSEKVSGIGRIRRVGNVVFVTALMETYLRRTSDSSESTLSLHEFEWPQFQRLGGADTALHSVPPKVRDRINFLLESEIRPEDLESGREETLFGAADESTLAFWVFGASMLPGSVRWEIPMQDIDSQNIGRGLPILRSLFFLICMALLVQGRRWL